MLFLLNAKNWTCFFFPVTVDLDEESEVKRKLGEFNTQDTWKTIEKVESSEKIWDIGTIRTR